MKQEPEWIDVLALIAMHSLLQTAPKSAKPEQIAYAAYQQAEAMMKEKERSDEYE
jgi:hypothetical protein